MLKLSESRYYRYLKRKVMLDQDELLSGEIQKILDENPLQRHLRRAPDAARASEARRILRAAATDAPEARARLAV